ncbi:MAG: hypothetical protein IKD78_10820 [Bacteroidales bacterium]|nr:hypothetical protein [Bacteroidales bacterium]
MAALHGWAVGLSYHGSRNNSGNCVCCFRQGFRVLSVQQAGRTTCFTACLNVLRSYGAVGGGGTPAG